MIAGRGLKRRITEVGEVLFIIFLVGGLLGMAIVSGLKRKWWNMSFWIYVGLGLGAFEIA